jgi:hypothetical protein
MTPGGRRAPFCATLGRMVPPAASTLDIVLNGLLDRYKAHVPDVDAIIRAMVSDGMIGQPPDIENDHIAFRTLGVPHLGIASLERVFLHYGYTPRDWFDFPAKKVTARWYHPPEERHPRIFISQLRVHELSAEAQAIVRRHTDRVAVDPVDGLNLDDGPAVVEFLHAPLWPSPTWAEYVRLREESEFAAWVIYNRYYLNHFTVSVHNLPPPHDSLARFNAFLAANGFTLNDAGGTIKTSADGKLLQSSTVAAMVDATFDDGRGGVEVHRIPGSYVEFAERRVLDQYAGLPRDLIRREHRRDGFEAASADRIFESTYTAQTGRRGQP